MGTLHQNKDPSEFGWHSNRCDSSICARLLRSGRIPLAERLHALLRLTDKHRSWFLLPVGVRAGVSRSAEDENKTLQKRRQNRRLFCDRGVILPKASASTTTQKTSGTLNSGAPLSFKNGTHTHTYTHKAPKD